MVWKCLVFPGVEETETFFAPIKALIVEDFPTLGYPTRPIWVFRGCSDLESDYVSRYNIQDHLLTHLEFQERAVRIALPAHPLSGYAFSRPPHLRLLHVPHHVP
jgi:hypothetical protein